MIHPLWGESEFRGGHGACHGELSAEGEKFLREHLHPDYFFDQNGSFLRKMSVWKPSPSIYITYQEPESDKKNQIFSKIPRNRSLAWKPSAYIYITYQEQKYDKKNQIFSKIPRNRSLARCNCWAIRFFSVWLSSFLGSANSSAARASRDSPSQ